MQAHAFYQICKSNMTPYKPFKSIVTISFRLFISTSKKSNYWKRERKGLLCRELKSSEILCIYIAQRGRTHRMQILNVVHIDSYFLHTAGSNTIPIIYDWRFLGDKNPIKHPIFPFPLYIHSFCKWVCSCFSPGRSAIHPITTQDSTF